MIYIRFLAHSSRDCPGDLVRSGDSTIMGLVEAPMK